MSKDCIIKQACTLKKIKEVGDEYKLTFDCGLKLPLKKELIVGIPTPKVGDHVCPEHSWIEKLRQKRSVRR